MSTAIMRELKWREEEERMSEKEDDYARRVSEAETYRDMLWLALEELQGNKEELCRRLWISLAELNDYLSGKQQVPFVVFIGALDIVLDGMRSRRP
jgi:hypothetical protein